MANPVEMAKAMRVALTLTATKSAPGSPANSVIDLLPLIADWEPGAYIAGDVRAYQGMPWRCVQGHDSRPNPNWTPGMAALWAPYHATDREHALSWHKPTGAHDAYQAGEYMLFDGKVYRCKTNATIHSPTEYAQAWEVVN